MDWSYCNLHSLNQILWVNAVIFAEYGDVIYVTLVIRLGMVVHETVRTGRHPHKALSET
jgi:hypothetical protein